MAVDVRHAEESGHSAMKAYHDIEVEDDVTAFVEYENGPRACLSHPRRCARTNGFEISAERGRLLLKTEPDLYRLRVSERQFNRNTRGFGCLSAGSVKSR